ncbi:hypothetical protein PHET_10345 [Paragonimus heterotremus]|uniref:Uncharacterized protein n=2 Tax=Paragonimus TaxID=34503 RepID=A0A8J4WCM0_9TREM|nr:hypothetical protein PHET_10345 [Paragonimus heterotremus]
MSSYERLPSKCPQVFDERSSNVKTGCWPRLEGHILEILTKISYVVIFTTLIEFVVACCAIYASMTIEEPRWSST